MNDNIRAIRTENFPPYKTKDFHTGRCRLPNVLFAKLDIRIGWILHIKLESSPDRATLICTAWPDTQLSLQNNEICADDAVILGSNSIKWMNCNCKIIEVYPPRISTSITAQGLKAISPINLRGLAVCSNATILNDIMIKTVNPVGKSAIISVNTLLIPSSSTTYNNDSNIKSPSTICVTDAVQKIIKLIVLPNFIYKYQNNIKGVLLLGPPGVGKSFAVTAVKDICRSFCNIKIFSLEIPTLLSTEDPLSYLSKILKEIQLPVTNDMKPNSYTNIPAGTSNARNNNTTSLNPTTPGTRSSNASTPLATSTTTTTPLSNQKKSKFQTTPQTYRRSPLPTTPIATTANTPTHTPNNNPTTTSSSITSSTTPAWSHSSSLSQYSAMSKSRSPLPISSDLRHNSFQNSPSNDRLILPEIRILLIDEIDALGPTPSSSIDNTSENNQSDVQIAAKSVLGYFLDALNSNENIPPIAIVATSNNVGDVDSSLLRGGRIEKVIEIQSGGVTDRLRMIDSLVKSGLSSPILVDVCSVEDKDTLHSNTVLQDLLQHMAESTGGYTPADLVSLLAETFRDFYSAFSNRNVISNNNNCNYIDGNGSSSSHNTNTNTNTNTNNVVIQLKSSFEKSKIKIQPSCLRGATVTLPELKLSDVIGLIEAKQSLLRLFSINAPKNSIQRDRNQRFGLSGGLGGALLYGPPGNSKTRLVLAVASEYHLPVVTLSAADVFSPYVGDSEATIRRAFRLARQSSPCILFFDELDALVGNREGEVSVSSESRILATLLSEMDGIGGVLQGGVIVLGATNRCDSIDKALIRKGRFHHLLHIPPPNKEEQVALLSYFCQKSNFTTLEELELQNRLREGMSGADIENICREAVMSKIRGLVGGKLR